MARTWQLRNENWQLPEEGAFMGILNVTPDSFSDGGQHNTLEAALTHAQKLIDEGADIIDIGGESTRPGAEPITVEEEQRRLLPILRALREKHPTLRISVDTRNPSTARAALEAGADIINDITGLTNPDMLQLCAEQPCGIVLMHMKGTLFHMPNARRNFNIIEEVRDYFAAQITAAEAAGISPARICLDPGIGFGKNTADNLTLIYELNKTRVRDLPLLMGLSRKRFLQEVEPPMPDTLGLNLPPPKKINEHEDPSIPTIAMSLVAADKGAEIHRVHDVAAHREALRLHHLYATLYPNRDDELVTQSDTYTDTTAAPSVIAPHSR